MTNECINIDQIEDILRLPENDPVRRHLSRCPRCSSLLVSYQAFVEAEPGSGMDPADADRRLMGFLEDRIGTRSPETSVDTGQERGGGWFASLRAAAAFRPAWAAAAVVILATVVLWWQPWVPDRPVLRSAESYTGMKMEPPQIQPDGTVRFRWQEVEGADGYVVVLNDPALDEIARFDIGRDTSYVLSRKSLPDGTPRVLICRVVALQTGDKIAETAPILFELP